MDRNQNRFAEFLAFAVGVAIESMGFDVMTMQPAMQVQITDSNTRHLKPV